MTRKKYSKEFKEDALRLVEREGVRYASEKLRIRENQIYDWRRHQRESQGILPKGMRSGEMVEEYARRLERENAE